MLADLAPHPGSGALASRSSSERLQLWGGWLGAAAACLALPLLLSSDSAVGVLCIIGVWVAFALSYNILLGQTGLLSFGHAIFFGLGGFCAIHVMNVVADAKLPIPLPLIPLVGGLGGLVFGVLFGSLASKRGGTIFAMISFGLGELVSSIAPILNRFFGGETGITTDRSTLYPLWGITFGPQIQVYYLIVAWCFITAGAIFFIARTPFGQIMRAVRENPERIEFIGCSTRKVRFLAFCLAAFFAGVAGALAAINFEIMTTSNVGGNQSAMVVLMTYIGGTGYFVGPIIGAILISLMQLLLSDVTAGWQMYLGLIFVIVVMYVPGGVASLFDPHAASARALRSPRSLLLVIPLLLAVAGAVLLVELGYQIGLKSSEGPDRTIFGVTFNSLSLGPWLAGVACLAIGLFGLRYGSLKPASRAGAATAGAQHA
ncbi:branched-chain amino acid ABC transporter permease [Bradyrhizobium sp.]|uniref:branched-chain amino acid ABC transporter permease n=1 Tax=Bradyrhizobium sp. TaxID=376 RepID=UPI0039E3DF87